MLILLPPSEGKTAPEAGPPLDLAALAFPAALTARRERVLAALVRLSAAQRPKRALDALGLSAGQAGELERNAALPDAPAHRLRTSTPACSTSACGCPSSRARRATAC